MHTVIKYIRQRKRVETKRHVKDSIPTPYSPIFKIGQHFDTLQSHLQNIRAGKFNAHSSA